MPALLVNDMWDTAKAARAQAFCDAFIASTDRPRYVLGRNVYARSVMERLPVTGVVDDFTEDIVYAGKPINKLADIPPESLVLAASGGRPLTVRRRLDDLGIAHLDYFAFLKFSALPLVDVVFNEGFREAFDQNRSNASWLHGLLEDEESKNILRKLLNFRYSLDLDHLVGFTDRQKEQYFEPFLELSADAVFWDVGGYDGYTASEFIRHHPRYRAVHVFEPDPINQKTSRQALASHPNVTVWPYGVGSENATVGFASNGSSSSIIEDGQFKIDVRRLDELNADLPTFIKMDIEGGEISALEGARRVITETKPKLAIAVYHRPSDIWNIPKLVMSMNPNYKVFLRHYTESIYETVMYFVPH